MERVVPGKLLGTSSEYKPGTGIYEEKGKLYAGIMGDPYIVTTEDKSKIVNIQPAGCNSYYPKIGDIIYGIVIDITSTDAKVEILAQEDEPLKHGQKYSGIIRYEHMRDYEIDKIVVEECLLPGDIVKAKIVISAYSYLY